MTEKKIRIGFTILKHFRDELEVLLRAIRLLYLSEMPFNEWRGKAFGRLITLCLELIPPGVIQLARDEPAELENRMKKLVKIKGRTLSHTSQLNAIRYWRKEMSIDAQEIMQKATMAAVIEETKPIESHVETPLVEEKPKKKPGRKIDIKGMVEKIIGNFFDEYEPIPGELPPSALVTDDIIVLRTQMISTWQVEGFLMRITAKESDQICWAWIRGDYEFEFPDMLTVEDIGDFDDLTPEENGHV